jgi:hypothetical protein
MARRTAYARRQWVDFEEDGIMAEAMLEDYIDCLYCPQYFGSHAVRVNFWYLIRGQLMAMHCAWLARREQDADEKFLMSGIPTNTKGRK